MCVCVYVGAFINTIYLTHRFMAPFCHFCDLTTKQYDVQSVIVIIMIIIITTTKYS